MQIEQVVSTADSILYFEPCYNNKLQGYKEAAKATG